MALPIPRDESTRISFAIYKPLKGYDIDDAVVHITKATASLDQNGGGKAAVLQSVKGSWVAVFSAWKEESKADESAQNLPGGLRESQHGFASAKFAQELSSVVRVVDSGWFQLSAQEHKSPSFAQLRVGDIVSVRRLYSDCSKQEVLAYCCLAVLKAYFPDMKGILSASFYRSMDGKRIIGLGIWDSIESAFAFVGRSPGTPAEVYWKDLGAKMLSYEVCKVVHVTAANTMTNNLVRQNSDRSP